MNKNRGAEKILLGLDELEQVSGGTNPTASDYEEAIDGFIKVFTKEIEKCDMGTPQGIAMAQYFRQEMEQSVLDMIDLCKKKTGVTLNNPLLTA